MVGKFNYNGPNETCSSILRTEQSGGKNNTGKNQTKNRFGSYFFKFHFTSLRKVFVPFLIAVVHSNSMTLFAFRVDIATPPISLTPHQTALNVLEIWENVFLLLVRVLSIVVVMVNAKNAAMPAKNDWSELRKSFREKCALRAGKGLFKHGSMCLF